MRYYQFAILGISAGGAYALLALGVTAIHRSTGVLNFALIAGALLLLTLIMNPGGIAGYVREQIVHHRLKRRSRAVAGDERAVQPDPADLVTG